MIFIHRQALRENIPVPTVEVVDRGMMMGVLADPEGERRQIEHRTKLAEPLVRAARTEKGVVAAIVLDDGNANDEAGAKQTEGQRQNVGKFKAPKGKIPAQCKRNESVGKLPKALP